MKRSNHFRNLILLWVAATLLLGACQPQPAWEDVKDPIWWHDAVFYEIFVRSYADSDGDGIGDFKGLTEKLDYLNDGDPETDDDLGITGIWLMPIHPSPSYHGYDVQDYLAVNPQYGTMEEFQTFLAEAHARGMRVIIDFVINHTSIEHPWFAASADGDTRYRDYYVWSESDPDYTGPWGAEAWHQTESGYYYGVFNSSMPDLNHENPQVVQEVRDIADYWLTQVGVDGFRIDGAKHLIEEGQEQENTDATHAWFGDFYAYYKETAPEAMTVGEIWNDSRTASEYVDNGEMDLTFNFELSDDIISGVTFRDANRVSRSLVLQEREFDPGWYAAFLTNHDMTRLMTKIGGEWSRAKAAATVLLTSPGVPFIYYGEEIGMTGDKPDELLRTPMQWTAGEQAGFTSGTPWARVNLDYTQKNVEDEAADPDSLLNHYRQLIRIRNDHYALRSGDLIEVKTGERSLLAILRVAEKEAVLVLINLSDDPIENVSLSWEASSLSGSLKPVILLGDGQVPTLAVNAAGGVEGFQALPEMDANQNLIVQFVR